MLLIILLGLIAKLTSVSGDCVVGTQHVNLNWNEFSGDRFWYYRLHTAGAVDGSVGCVVQKYASPVGNTSQIVNKAVDVSTQSPITVTGYATNWNSTYWEENYSQMPILTGRSYPLAVDYDLYLIYKFCFTESNQLNVYVAYRKPFPDEETVNLVKKKLEENNIEYSELVEFSIKNCNFADS